MDNLKTAHYFSLPSQGNIYTLAKLHLASGSSKLLVASLKREVFCFEYSETSNGILIPTVKEVSFTYIPSGAEIISIDAFNKSQTENDFVIGITIIKNSNDLNTLETYLNIYSDSDESKEFHIENIAQNCLNVELNFIPYHLTHSELLTWSEDNCITKEVVFILSGSDNQVHVYRENTSNHIYKEIDKKEYFPEFSRPPSIVVWIDICYFESSAGFERITAFGCECGYVRLCRVSVKANHIIYSHSIRFDNFVTTLRIYPEVDDSTAISAYFHNKDKDEPKETPMLNLIVVNSVLPPVFFSDILKYGMKKCGTLPRSDMTNIFTSLAVVDIDFDGCKEILIGNSIEDIMLYKFNKEKGWCLTNIRKLGAPIFGIMCEDITGDGVKEFIVLTMKGVHILQHDLEMVEQIFEKKVKSLKLAAPSTK